MPSRQLSVLLAEQNNGARHAMSTTSLTKYPTEAARAIEVMEDLLNFLYEFDYKASQIKNASRRAELRE